jgi:hypothetical protein
LFFAYEFMAEMHTRPLSFLELFDFMRFNKTKGIMRATAMAAMKQRSENG